MADNNHDDLDFSDLDLDGASDGFGDDADTGAHDDAAPAKPRTNPVLMYAFIGLIVLAGAGGIAAWQMGLLGGGTPAAPAPYTADAGQPQPGMGMDPNAMPVVQDAAGANDPFNVMGTPSGQPVLGPDGMPIPDNAQFDATGMPIQQDQLPPVALDGDIAEAPVTSVMPAQAPALITPPVEGSTVPMPQPVPDIVPPTTTADGMTPAASGEAIPLTPETAGMPVVNAPIDAPSGTAATLAPDSFTTTPQPTAANDALIQENEQLSRELSDLRSELAALRAEKDKAVNAAAKAEAKASAPVTSEAAPKAPVKKKTAAKKPAKKKAVSQWDKPYNGGAVIGSSQTVAPNATVPVLTDGNLSLRAAQEGTAWVADGSGRLQEVRVGDTLPNVGTVQAITQSGGQWSIVGSQGRVSQ